MMSQESQRQNSERLQTLEELQRRQAELDDMSEKLRKCQAELAVAQQKLQAQQDTILLLNRELDDTNRGVVALYAELEEHADTLRRASETKSRFLSNMSHEFRTPLYSILGLTGLLLDEQDVQFSPEQTKQVLLIRKAAEGLTELVNDLLDLAKVEAGKVVVRPHEFDIGALFGALRGLLKPLLTGNSEVSLTFVEPVGIPVLNTDESKLSQILRNFISNALKFTEKGEVRVTAALAPGDTIEISVTDTGMGIAPEDIGRVFQEFTQLENSSRSRIKGTGLGLPLSRRLAELLGGRITVASSPGAGSTFSVILPRSYRGPREVTYSSSIVRDPYAPPNSVTSVAPGQTILVIDDDEGTRYLLHELLRSLGLQGLDAADGSDGIRRAHTELPKAIILDLCLPGMDGWEVLKALKSSSTTWAIPVILHSSTAVEEIARHALASSAAAIVCKAEKSREATRAALRDAFHKIGLLAEVAESNA